MATAFEVPADDPQAVAEAIARAAEGEVVHLMRHGRPVADVVPANSQGPRSPRKKLSEKEWAAVVERSTRMAARFGAPTLEHYRRVYQALRQPWPGDENIRSRYPVADIG